MTIGGGVGIDEIAAVAVAREPKDSNGNDLSGPDKSNGDQGKKSGKYRKIVLGFLFWVFC